MSKEINYYIFYTNLIKPLFWGCILVYLIIDMKRNYIRTKLRKGSLIYISLISSIHIIIYFYLGFAFGFSKSPYNHGITFIIKNCIIEILPIIGIEITRYMLMKRNKNNKTAIVITTTILILAEINYYALIKSFNNIEECFKYIFGTLTPLISSSCLYTYVTLKENYLTVLIMRVPIKLSELLLPILANVNWFMIGAIELIYSAMIYLIFKYRYAENMKNKKYNKKKCFSKVYDSMSIIICSTIVCFMLGLFKYKPITILSNSMQPTFGKADIVIYEKLSDEKLKKLPLNTIIIYNLDNQYIAHRIIARVREGGKIKYQTQGDCNNVADMKLVETEQIKGIYNFRIKYIGMPSVMLYEFFNYENAKVETKEELK